jgi:DNA-binding protein HU-beta
MNQADLIATVAEHASLTKADAGKAVEALVDTITEALKQGEEVRIAGFGTFGISERGGPQSSDRRADHDRASKVAKFTAGKAVKNALNG